MNYERLNQLEIDYAAQSKLYSRLNQALKSVKNPESRNGISIEIQLCKSSMMRIKNEFESILDCDLGESVITMT